MGLEGIVAALDDEHLQAGRVEPEDHAIDRYGRAVMQGAP
jgi:hypothetical protein